MFLRLNVPTGGSSYNSKFSTVGRFYDSKFSQKGVPVTYSSYRGRAFLRLKAFRWDFLGLKVSIGGISYGAKSSYR